MTVPPTPRGPALVAAVALFATIAACSDAPPRRDPAPTPAPIVDGKVLFATYCSTCHGPEGRGDGPAAYLLWPRPRDFSTGAFKVRSTAGLPTDADLLATITNGMPGSSMPSWRQLGEVERQSLVRHVKTLSSARDKAGATLFNHFEKGPAGEPIAVPPEPAATPESVARGREVYVRVGCIKCHGDTGRADGPSAADLKDSLEQPIRPNDFTQGLYKGGASNRDVYLRFAAGMAGTPMPAFGPDQMSDVERWSLVHYVQSLSAGKTEDRVAVLPAGSGIRAAKVAALPKDPADPAWDRVPAVDLPLDLLFHRTLAPRRLKVRAAHDGARIAFQLSWADGAQDGAPLRPEDFRDGVALQFALKGMDTPIMMGNADRPVNLWHWKADWQADLAGHQDVEKAHPGMVVDAYPFEKDEATVAGKGNRPSALSNHDKAFQSGWAAGNPMSRPDRNSPVEDLDAAGFGTLRSLPADRQAVQGQGNWAGGTWKVQVSRALAPTDPRGAAFTPGREIPISFAVWDGRAGDRNGQKSVTNWYRLSLD